MTKKRLSGIVLLILIVVSQIMSLLLLPYHFLQWQDTAERELSSNNKSFHLTLSVEEFKSAQINPKEIFYHGNLLDIRILSINQQEVHLMCFNDHSELNYLEQLNSLFSKNRNSANQPEQDQAIKIFHTESYTSFEFIFEPGFKINHRRVTSELWPVSHFPDTALRPPQS